MRMIPSGQYLAQDAHPVHRSSYQTNSSPRKRRCWGTRSSGYWIVKGGLSMFLMVTIRPLTRPMPYTATRLP